MGMHRDAARRIQFILHGFQFFQGVVFRNGEFRTDVGGAHAGDRVFFGILHVVGVVALDEAAVFGDDGGQVLGHGRIEEGRVQVRADLADHEARPGVGAAVLLETFLQEHEELAEDRLVGQAAVDFFRSDFVCDGIESPLFPEILDMRDEFDRPFCHNLNLDRLTLRKEAVDGRIDVNQFITGEQRSLIGLLDAVHRLLVRPHLQGLDVLEPGAAVVDRCNIRASVVVALGLDLHHADEVFLGHARVAPVVVHLVEGGGEHDGSVVALRGAERGLDDGRGVRAHREERHRLVAFGRQRLDPVQQLSQFRFHDTLFLILVYFYSTNYS